MKKPFKRSALLALLLATSLHTAPAWAQNDYGDYLPQAYQQGDITFISGGIGENETEALREVMGQYNLRITSADKTGHFRGDTEIVIRDMKKNVLLDVTTSGPLFYVNLPDGRYSIEGISEDQSKMQTVRVTRGKSARVHFSWPVSYADAVAAPRAQSLFEPTRISRDPIVTR